jgi:hypothetical protein
MGVAVRRTYRVKRVEGPRDETRTIKTNWSAAQCGDDQRKALRHEPARLVTDSRRYLFGQRLTVSLSDRSVLEQGSPHGSTRLSVSSPQNMLADADAKCIHSTHNHHNHREGENERRQDTRSM